MRAALLALAWPGAKDPSELNALTVRFHAIGASHTKARSDVAERAIAAHPASGGAWLLKAWAAPAGGSRRAALDRALELAPDHPGVALFLAQDLLRRGEAQAALTHIRLALRRSPPTADLLALHVRALGGVQRCDEAAALATSASGLFAPECQVLVAEKNQVLGCAVFVQQAYAALGSACPASKG